jgi:hypothetical protein
MAQGAAVGIENDIGGRSAGAFGHARKGHFSGLLSVKRSEVSHTEGIWGKGIAQWRRKSSNVRSRT